MRQFDCIRARHPDPNYVNVKVSVAGKTVKSLIFKNVNIFLTPAARNMIKVRDVGV